MTMEAKSSSHNSSTSTLFDKLSFLDKSTNEPRQQWLSGATLAMLSTLLLSSIGGFVLSGLVLGNTFDVKGQCASQSFVLFASILAVPYLTLHLRAAQMDFLVTRSQPFQHHLHSWTIIIARLDFLAWAVAVIAASVAVAKATGDDKVHLQLDLFICVLAFLAMTFCLAVVEKGAEPFVLPWISPSRPVVCRISESDSMVDNSISRRGSTGSAKRTVPAGPRPMSNIYSTAWEPAALRKPENDLLFPRDAYDMKDATAKSEALRMPEPTLPPQYDQYKPHIPWPSKDWKDDWSIFVGEAGLPDSAGSTVAGDMTTFAGSSASESSWLPSAPYSVWTPIKPSQPVTRSYKSGSPSWSLRKRSLLPALPEVKTPPTVDIVDSMGGYPKSAPPPSPAAGANVVYGSKPRKVRLTRVPKSTVEEVTDESLASPRISGTSIVTRLDTEQSVGSARATTPKIPGSFVEE